MKKFLKWIKSPASDFALFVLILILANIAAHKAFLRFDLTGQRSYTISKASKDVVSNLQQPLSIKVFFSDNLPAPYNGVSQYVKDILVEYKGAANRNFSYQIFNMKKPESQKTARDYGIHQAQIQQLTNSEVSAKQVYMGLAITYGDAIEVIDQITDDSGFEYNLTTKIARMINQQDTLAGLSGGDTITLTLYQSNVIKDLPIRGIAEVRDVVKAAFDSVNAKNQNRLSFVTESPSATEAEAISEQYGVQLLNTSQSETPEYAVFGLVLEYADNFISIPLSIRRGFFGGYGIAGLENLEESISGSLQSLLSKSTEIGYITGHEEAEFTDENGQEMQFRKLLEDMYTFRTLNLAEDDIPAGLSTIIINGPHKLFDEAELYKIDQFVMRGGNLMVFHDPLEQSQANQYQGASYIPLDTGLNRILEKYGIILEHNYVLDENCFVYNQGQGVSMKQYWVPMLSKQSMSQKSVISKNLGYVIFGFPGNVNVDGAIADKNLTVTQLAKSSKRSWILSDNIQLSAYMQPPYNKSEFTQGNLAVLVEGKFTSAFDKNPTEQEDATKSGFTTTEHVAKAARAGKIFAAGTSYITSNYQINERGNEPIAIFIRNAVDYMNGNTDLCTMRTKGLSFDTLQNTNTVLAVILRYFNQFGLTVIVAILGLVAWRMRVLRKKRIHDTYNPDDSREIK